ncbi:hypothetical protein Pcinc_026830 [Petrolisthes cinctipes]|uniref:Vitelline membrane outer layer protein 1 homolog n=1 Tax=Petrolisthes cinctipes TaxID=88211 RepID=A0AAE1F6N1_PETCI|nr:hypothetical protein Pcinc_026830 [Petrolisthes cinctipes]
MLVLLLLLFPGQVILESTDDVFVVGRVVVKARQTTARITTTTIHTSFYRAPVALLTPDDVTEASMWGDWGPNQQCPEFTFASAFSLKVENNQIMFDSTALNGVSLVCRAGRRHGSVVGNVTSTVAPWGKWKATRECLPGEFLVGMQVRMEGMSDSLLDNTATNDLSMSCEGGGVLNGGGEKWGSWGKWKRCPRGSAICGITTNVQEPQGPLVDDLALVTLRMDCCSL